MTSRMARTTEACTPSPEAIMHVNLVALSLEPSGERTTIAS
jgi:hypothetical protein